MTWKVEIIRAQRLTVQMEDFEANTPDQAAERAERIIENNPWLWTGADAHHTRPHATIAAHYTGATLIKRHYIPRTGPNPEAGNPKGEGAYDLD